MKTKKTNAAAPKVEGKVTPISAAKRGAATKPVEAAEKVVKARKPRPQNYSGPLDKNATIRVLVADNPKRPGSATHERFKLYKTGKTVAELLHQGVTTLDLRWDLGEGRNFIALDEPKAAPAAKGKKGAKADKGEATAS